ncbi:hypothetical protein B0H13DRAFT_2322949 [Mycena leptocephala]|nr:hypothetical protein B0H13DRAFT_2322949 [Mycena leptocephala]
MSASTRVDTGPNRNFKDPTYHRPDPPSPSQCNRELRLKCAKSGINAGNNYLQPATKLISTASAQFDCPFPSIHLLPRQFDPARENSAPILAATRERTGCAITRNVAPTAWHLATVSAPVTASLKSPQAHKSRGSVQSTQTGSSRRHHPPHCPQLHLRVYPLPSLESSPVFPTYLLPPRPKPWQF